MSKALSSGRRLVAIVAINIIVAGALIWTASQVFAKKEGRRDFEDPALLNLPRVPDLPRPSLEIVAHEKEVTNPTIRAPWIEFSIKNITKVPILVVPPLDGSDYGWRSPKCSVMIWNAAGLRVEPPLPVRCGNMNGLALNDFVTLEPGATLPINHFLVHPGNALPEGQYMIQCVYGTEGSYKSWLGWPSFHTPEILSRIDQVPKGTFLSAPVQVHVRK